MHIILLNSSLRSLHGKDCSQQSFCISSIHGGQRRLVGQRICPWLKIAPCIFHTSHIHVGRMDGSRTAHMYRTYGSRAMQELLPRSGCRGAVAEVRSTNFARSKIERMQNDIKGKLHGRNLPFGLHKTHSILLLAKLMPR